MLEKGRERGEGEGEGEGGRTWGQEEGTKERKGIGWKGSGRGWMKSRKGRGRLEGEEGEY